MLSEEEELEYLQMKKRRAAAGKKPEDKRSPVQMMATEAVKGFGQGGVVGSAGRAVVEGGKHALKKYDELAYDVGGKVADFSSGMGASPTAAGILGGSANLGMGMLPLGGIAKLGAKVFGIPLAKLGTKSAEELMGSALKPTPTQWAKGEGKIAVDTMLEKGLAVSQKSVFKLHQELEGLQNQVSKAIEKSGGTVSKSAIKKTIEESMKFFKGGTSEVQDLKVIKDVIKEFEKAPSVKGLQEIPVQVAQRMKTLEYRKIDKSYGVMGDAEEVARKGTARGLKEGIEKVAPEVKALNAEEQKIFQTLPVLERRAMMEINRNPAGLASLAHNPKVAAAMMLDKSSLFKSWLANKINAFSNKMIPGMSQTGADLAGEAAAVSLYELGRRK